MKLNKIAVLFLASVLSITSTHALAVAKKPAAKTPIKKVFKSAPVQAKRPVAPKNETKSLYGVKGAQLKHVKVSNSTRSYTEKGKVHQVIGQEASRQFSQVGLASYYAGKFHGRKTANGEIYDKHEYTAAHKTLALGSYALITNLRNGRQIIVRINDRGPYSSERILDLSKGAARELGMIQSGTARVRLEAMQVDKNGYISGKAAHSLVKLAKREGLPLNIKGEGELLAIKADDTVKNSKTELVSNPN